MNETLNQAMCFMNTGLSILQNGKIPTFLGDDVKKAVFDGSQTPTMQCLQQLREGFQNVGIFQVNLLNNCINPLT